MGVKILICGGRDFDNYNLLRDSLHKIIMERGWHHGDKYNTYNVKIISGGARGADTLAADFAIVNYLPFLEIKAEWKKYGPAAGMIRNQKMLEQKPDLVVAFPGGRGTADMVSRAKKAGIEVIEIK